MNTFQKDLLTVNVYESRTEMGEAAAADIKACILSLLQTKETINMIFAAAPSQNEVLYALATDTEIPWNRVNAFHMDEYIGLSADAPQGFGNFLKEHIFGLADFKSVSYINVSASDAEAECERYAALLAKHPTDIVVMGILRSTIRPLPISRIPRRSSPLSWIRSAATSRSTTAALQGWRTCPKRRSRLPFRLFLREIICSASFPQGPRQEQ